MCEDPQTTANHDTKNKKVVKSDDEMIVDQSKGDTDAPPSPKQKSDELGCSPKREHKSPPREESPDPKKAKSEQQSCG